MWGDAGPSVPWACPVSWLRLDRSLQISQTWGCRPPGLSRWETCNPSPTCFHRKQANDDGVFFWIEARQKFFFSLPYVKRVVAQFFHRGDVGVRYTAQQITYENRYIIIQKTVCVGHVHCNGSRAHPHTWAFFLNYTPACTTHIHWSNDHFYPFGYESI